MKTIFLVVCLSFLISYCAGRQVDYHPSDYSAKKDADKSQDDEDAYEPVDIVSDINSATEEIEKTFETEVQTDNSVVEETFETEVQTEVEAEVEADSSVVEETFETAVQADSSVVEEISESMEDIFDAILDAQIESYDAQIESGEILNPCDCTVYKNTVKGFAFAYPQKWTIVFDDGNRIDLDSNASAGADETDRIYVSIEILQNNTGGSDDEWIAELKERFVDAIALDEKAIKVDISGTGEHLGLYTVVSLKNATIGVNLRYIYPVFEKITDVKVMFAKIIASFTDI